MARRSLFLGLTGMLVVVLGYLVVQGRKQEKLHQKNPRPVELVQESKPTPIRVMAPPDLQIIEAKLELSGADAGVAKESGLSAKHQVIVRNNGQSAYRNIRFRLTYLSRGDKVLGSQIREAGETLQGGQSRSMGDILVEGIPPGTAKSAVTILSADLELASTRPK
jgi:hypothetical protein